MGKGTTYMHGEFCHPDRFVEGVPERLYLVLNGLQSEIIDVNTYNIRFLVFRDECHEALPDEREAQVSRTER
jgi:hypothetical protein